MLHHLPAVLFISTVFASAARLPIAVLHVDLPDLDSAGREELARDLGRMLAADSGFLVYDARAQNAVALDRAFENGLDLESDVRKRVHGGVIRRGLAARCQMEDASIQNPALLCQFVSLELGEGGGEIRDSALFEAELERKPEAMKPILAAKLRALLAPPPREERPKAPPLQLLQPARPARLVRRLEIQERGAIPGIPLGQTLQTGDLPGYAVAKSEGYYLILFPHSSYTYLLPGVLCLNEGFLGVVKAEDTTSLAAQIKSVTHLDQSNVLWKTVAQLAALDSSNLVWQSLGKIVSLDSQSVAGKLRQVVSLDSTNPVYRTLGKLVQLDSGNLVLRTLAEVSALDSSNLIWKGIGQVSGLDSNHSVWRKLAHVADLDSGSLWRKIGLLAMHEDAMILTPSCVIRGRPGVLQIRQRGSLTRLDLPQGELMILPVLSTQQPAALRDLEWGETHGFALERGRLAAKRGDRLASQLGLAVPRSGKHTLADWLPGRLFARGASIPVFSDGVQSHGAAALSEIGATPETLNWEPSWPKAGPSETGSHESGCYLCRPDRLGP